MNNKELVHRLISKLFNTNEEYPYGQCKNYIIEMGIRAVENKSQDKENMRQECWLLIYEVLLNFDFKNQDNNKVLLWLCDLNNLNRKTKHSYEKAKNQLFRYMKIKFQEKGRLHQEDTFYELDTTRKINNKNIIN